MPQDNSVKLVKDPQHEHLVLLEAYKQAHELRRKWESHIWQWGFVVTGLAAFYAYTNHAKPVAASWPQVVILTLLTLFFLAVAFNVLRARSLMKAVEKNINSFHKAHAIDLPMLPLELDDLDKQSHTETSKKRSTWEVFGGRIKHLSSTRIAVAFHFAAFLAFLFLTIWTFLSVCGFIHP